MHFYNVDDGYRCVGDFIRCFGGKYCVLGMSNGRGSRSDSRAAGVLKSRVRTSDSKVV